MNVCIYFCGVLLHVMKQISYLRTNKNKYEYEYEYESSFANNTNVVPWISCRDYITNGYFSVIPPPYQKIRKTVEIVPEKMTKSSIEILQILVLSN